MKGSYFGNFINGKWVQHPGRDVFEVRNPATNQIIATIEQGTKEDIELAVNVAESKFESWRKIPAPKRGEIILEAARILRDEKEELARRIVIQNGKIISEARGEVQEAIDFFEYIAGEGRRLWGETIPSELPNKICLTFRKPIGVVALITPFNYPLAIPAWKIGAALICGNTIVMKPPSLTPLGAIDLANIFQRAGLPDGVFNLVFGRGEEVGMALVEHPKIRVVSFTGGEEVGRRIYQQAASDLKRVHLELGGHAPEIILEDANIDLAIEAVLFGAFGTSGQRCTTTRRLLVSSVIYDKVKTKLIQKIRSLKVGDPLDETTDVGPVINLSSLQMFEAECQLAKEEGGKILIGGKKINVNGLSGFFFSPTLIEAKQGMRITTEEIFGPILSLIKFNSLEEAIEIANSTRYGLASSIFTSDINKAMEAIERLDFGITYVNGATIGAEISTPFGSTKTGIGREAGSVAIDEFSEIQTVYIDYSNQLQKAQIDY